MTDSNDWDVIVSYTAEQAVADGVLVQQSPATALEAGYRIPVLLTRKAFEDVVEWTRDGAWQSEDARFWDVLNVGRAAARAALHAPGERFGFRVLRIPNQTATGRPSSSTTATLARLEVTVEGFNTSGAACIIICLPGED